MSIRCAARRHDIPESTLRFRLSNPRGLDVNMSGLTIFSVKKKQELALATIHVLLYNYTCFDEIHLLIRNVNGNGISLDHSLPQSFKGVAMVLSKLLPGNPAQQQACCHSKRSEKNLTSFYYITYKG